MNNNRIATRPQNAMVSSALQQAERARMEWVRRHNPEASRRTRSRDGTVKHGRPDARNNHANAHQFTTPAPPIPGAIHYPGVPQVPLGPMAYQQGFLYPEYHMAPHFHPQLGQMQHTGAPALPHSSYGHFMPHPYMPAYHNNPPGNHIAAQSQQAQDVHVVSPEQASSSRDTSTSKVAQDAIHEDAIHEDHTSISEVNDETATISSPSSTESILSPDSDLFWILYTAAYDLDDSDTAFFVLADYSSYDIKPTNSLEQTPESSPYAPPTDRKLIGVTSTQSCPPANNERTFKHVNRHAVSQNSTPTAKPASRRTRSSANPRAHFTPRRWIGENAN